MIRLTNDLVLTADEHQYIVGRAKRGRDGAMEVRSPRYYTSAAQAVRGALDLTMRAAVRDGDVATLWEFVQKQEALLKELQN